MKYEPFFIKEALKDVKKSDPKLKEKLKEIIVNRVANDPTSGKKLVGDLTGFFSVRLSYKDRIICSVNEKENHLQC